MRLIIILISFLFLANCENTISTGGSSYCVGNNCFDNLYSESDDDDDDDDDDNDNDNGNSNSNSDGQLINDPQVEEVTAQQTEETPQLANSRSQTVAHVDRPGSPEWRRALVLSRITDDLPRWTTEDAKKYFNGKGYKFFSGPRNTSKGYVWIDFEICDDGNYRQVDMPVAFYVE